MAETVRLRNLQKPSHVERLLENLVSHAGLVPPGAYPVSRSQVSARELRSIATQATKHGRTWSCWEHNFHSWMFTAEMSLALSLERGRPVLQVDIHDDRGFSDSGPWIADRDGKWSRCGD